MSNKQIHKLLNRQLVVLVMLCFGMAVMTSCINEDLSDCGKEFEVAYDLDLQTNLTTEISTNLTTAMEQKLGKEIMSKLSNIFRKYANDVDLYFFTSDSLCAYHETNIIEDTAAVYTIHLPVRDYMHLSSANTLIEPAVVCKGDNYAPDYRIEAKGDEILKCQNVGLFSARLPMVVENADQVFNVSLYMLNAASVLVLDQNFQKVKQIKAYVNGLADCFHVRDSVYTYNDSKKLEQKTITTDDPQLFALYGVGFPSRDISQAYTRADEPQVDEESEGSLWEYEVYVTMDNGKVTKSVLYVKTPLMPGTMKMLKAKVGPDGALIPYGGTEVGVSVTFDWKEGGSFEGDMD